MQLPPTQIFLESNSTKWKQAHVKLKYQVDRLPQRAAEAVLLIKTDWNVWSEMNTCMEHGQSTKMTALMFGAAHK